MVRALDVERLVNVEPDIGRRQRSQQAHAVDEVEQGHAVRRDYHRAVLADLRQPPAISGRVQATCLAEVQPEEARILACQEGFAGRLVLSGSVADTAARTQLVDIAGTVVDPTNVDDRLRVDADATADAAGLDALGGLIAAMPTNLVSGTATLGADGTLAISGVYVDDAARDAVAAAAATAGADTDLSARPDATASDAAALADELNAFVTANPILFAPGRATLTPEASAVVDQVAAIANRFAGVQIAVVGHTDTDGDASRNLTLSEQRAAAVRDALVARGVTAPLTSSGRGETEPVLVNGVEDKAASRRVVFDVTAS